MDTKASGAFGEKKVRLFVKECKHNQPLGFSAFRTNSQEKLKHELLIRENGSETFYS